MNIGDRVRYIREDTEDEYNAIIKTAEESGCYIWKKRR